MVRSLPGAMSLSMHQARKVMCSLNIESIKRKPYLSRFQSQKGPKRLFGAIPCHKRTSEYFRAVLMSTNLLQSWRSL
jgi:hypothetical protein